MNPINPKANVAKINTFISLVKYPEVNTVITSPINIIIPPIVGVPVFDK